MRFLGGITDALYAFIYGTDWQGGIDKIGAGFNSFMTFIAPITTALKSLYNTAAPIIAKLYDAIVTQLASPSTQAQLDGLAKIFTLLADILVGVVALAINAMKVQFQGFYNVFTVVWPYVQTAIRIWMTIMQPLQDLVIGVLSAISDVLKGNFLGAWDTVKNAVLTFISTINTSINTFASNAIAKIIEMISSLATQAAKVGSAIANGIARGISDGADAIVNAAKEAAMAAFNAAKKALGIASPSKLFADQVGFQMSAGMAAGIIRGIPDITGAISGATGASVGAVNQTTQNYYLSASYQTAQSESSISQDLRAMQLLAGGMA
jgi:phage-related protein